MAKQPTIDTCVLSGKPIRQSHIDDKLVIEYGKGRAFVSAISNTVKSPSENPVVFSSNQLSVVSIAYEKYTFPSRIIMQGKTFSEFPKLIFVQNQLFKLHGNNVIKSHPVPRGLIDVKSEVGIAVYKRTNTYPQKKEVVEPEVEFVEDLDKPSED